MIATLRLSEDVSVNVAWDRTPRNNALHRSMTTDLPHPEKRTGEKKDGKFDIHKTASIPELPWKMGRSIYTRPPQFLNCLGRRASRPAKAPASRKEGKKRMGDSLEFQGHR